MGKIWKWIRKDFTTIVVVFNIVLTLAFIICVSLANIRGFEIQDSVIYGFFGFFGAENGCCAFVYKHKARALEIADKALETSQTMITELSNVEINDGRDPEEIAKEEV